jgi:N-methylhydantoinase A
VRSGQNYTDDRHVEREVIAPYSSRGVRIGIDVGGTFTDFIVADRADGGMILHKEPSTPSNPAFAVANGLAALVERGAVDPRRVELVVHGTTIGLNAIIQRRGARMALVVSEGNRDVLEIARLRLASSYDFTAPRERPLVPRDRVFTVRARMASDGSVLRDVDAAEVARIGAQIRAADVEAVAVMLLNSYRDAALEIRLADMLRSELPGVAVTESALVWPEVREYERCLIACLNASIAPLMSGYLDRLATLVREAGIAAPIYITANNGGTLALPSARSRPVDTILSGPASGVVSSTKVGGATGHQQLVTFDMGGTSADIAICSAGAPEFTTVTQVGDFPLMMPVVNVAAIGAGGGSVLWVDSEGLLKVGPHSAGAEPGPVAYGRGGTQPTLTDCYLVLGILDPARFLGGRMRLDVAAARAALAEIGSRIGLDVAAVAEAALRVASAKMATEIVKLLAQAGEDPRRYALLAYGGAGPTHASLLAREARLHRVLVPMAPGAFCAMGAILADVRRDYVRTARHLVASAHGEADGWPLLESALAALKAEALDWISREGDIVGEHALAVTADMRYPGQAYDIRIDVPDAVLSDLDGPALAALFHAAHLRLYGFSEPASAVEVTTLRLGVIGRVPPLTLSDCPPRAATAPESRDLRIDGACVTAAVYRRADLGSGQIITGPAVIEQEDTTTLILPGWTAIVDRIGTLDITEDGT